MYFYFIFLDFLEENEKQYNYDVFISYSQSDRPWVRDVLMKTLEENGKKVCVDFRDFTPGVPITENIIEAIVESKVTILVLTPSFIESEWCKYESRHALGVSLETCQGRSAFTAYFCLQSGKLELFRTALFLTIKGHNYQSLVIFTNHLSRAVF